MSPTLTIPSDAGYAAAALVVEIFVKPHLPDLVVEQGQELSLTTSSSSSPQTGSFLPIYKTLLEQADQQASSNVEVEQWITAATSKDLPVKELDEHLANKTFLADNKLTAADVAVFAKLQPYMASASHDTLLSHPNVTRHFDLIQNTPSVASALTKLSPNTISSNVVPIDLDNVPLVERKYESAKKDKKKDKDASASAAASGEQAPGGKGKGRNKGGNVAAAAAAAAAEPKEGEAPAAVPEKEGKKEKKEKAKKENAAGAEGGAKASKKDKSGGGGGGGGGAAAVPDAITPGLIDLRVGKIVEIEKHPDADSLYVEKIDIGEAEPRTVVSGLVNYIPIEQMRGKYLIAVCNLKPASMRGIKSYAMVLCATSPEGKGGPGSIELVDPPAGSVPGERIYFEGFESVKALEQLPPKKKIFETIQPGFTTLENREAAWVDPSDKNKVARIRTEKGVCVAPNFVGASLS